MSNPVTYGYYLWQPDAAGADSNHPVTASDPMSAGSSNDAAGWVRRLESEMRRRSSVAAQWEEWLGINPPYAPSPSAPTYISATQFSLPGDWTTPAAGWYPAIAIVGRRIKAFITSYPSPGGIVGTITAATFALGVTTITAAWDNGKSLDGSVTEVQFGIPAPGGSSNASLAIYKHTDQVLTSSPVADPDLVVSIGAGEEWLLRFLLFTNITASDFTLTIGATYPAGGSVTLAQPNIGSWSHTSLAVACNDAVNTFEIVMLVSGGSAGGNATLTYATLYALGTKIFGNSTLVATRVV